VTRLPDIAVDIYHDDKLYMSGVRLQEAFPDDAQGYALAHADLVYSGEHRCGGGAAPAFELRRSSQ
jgi:hypothetical protein